jgi:hypothetical protein
MYSQQESFGDLTQLLRMQQRTRMQPANEMEKRAITLNEYHARVALAFILAGLEPQMSILSAKASSSLSLSCIHHLF